ncbi:hypothetical protein IPA_04650 [Ignicoccus pacificus DSM 13166]|uniref:Uncharacterized protein n=1 Tax=Ignicoccus pacificus DSM 13166 TaxID=940294 RepID=A0A977PLK3_9CREN|nr:hypothetical protein IPA_04650 [Ignicoccus pacificus DSM 13166]
MISKDLDSFIKSNTSGLEYSQVLKAEWYALMLSTSPYRFNSTYLLDCVKKNSNNEIGKICLIALKGLYKSMESNVLPTRYIDPCILNNLKYLNSSFSKSLALWTISQYLGLRPRLPSTDIYLISELLKSAYAYFKYYNPKYIQFIKNLYAALTGSCRPLEAYTLLLSYLTKGKEWWMYYPLYLKILSMFFKQRSTSS